LAGQFDELLTSLRSHELGHYRIAQEAAAAIDSRLGALPEMADCRTLTSTADGIGSRILAEYREKELQYDAATDHGYDQ
jgi:predicted secreted Zn-dependent protease